MPFRGTAEGSIGTGDSDYLSLLPSHATAASVNGTCTLHTGPLVETEKEASLQGGHISQLDRHQLKSSCSLVVLNNSVRPSSPQHRVGLRTRLVRWSEASGASGSPGPPWGSRLEWDSKGSRNDSRSLLLLAVVRACFKHLKLNRVLNILFPIA